MESSPSGEFKLSLQSKLIILTAVLASLLEIIDTSIVNVAIPTMMGNLGATLEDISWVVTGYIIANAIVLPLSAWLASRIGRRRYYVGCIFIFTGTSVACGFAPNLETLVVFRIFQGLAGGALLPTSQSLIQEQFPREKSGTASAIYGMSVMIGPTLGPTLGGYLTDHFGWRSIFNINLPLGLFAATLALTYVTDIPAALGAIKKKIDSLGLLLLCVGIGCLQFVLERGEADSWFESNAILICSILSIVALPTFIWWELKINNPIINLRLFKHAIVRSGTALMMMLGFLLYGLIFILPVFMGRMLNYDATQTGMMFIPGALLTAFTMPLVGKLLQKVDPRYLIGFGFSMMAVMLFSLTFYSPQTGADSIFWTLMIRGAGMGFLFVPINAVVLGSFRGAELGQVAGLMNLLRQIGGSVGIALIGTLLTRNSAQNYLDLVSHVSPLEVSTLANVPANVNIMAPSQGFLAQLDFRVSQQVFMMSFGQMMWTLLLVLPIVIIPIMMVKTKGKVSAPVDAH